MQFYLQGCLHAWVNAHKRLSCGRKWAWPRVVFVNVCVCALSSRQTSSETRRAEIRESRLTWDAGQHLKRALWQSSCCLATSNHNNCSVSQLPGLRLYPGVSYRRPSPHFHQVVCLPVYLCLFHTIPNSSNYIITIRHDSPVRGCLLLPILTLAGGV